MSPIANRLLVVGYLSIDTIEQADGSACRQAGGAGAYAALGARLAGASVDLCASVGHDFPPQWLAAVGSAGVDLVQVSHRQVPSRWAHIVHGAHGARRSLHVADPAWWAASRDHAPAIPDNLSSYDRVIACPMSPACLEALLGAAQRAAVPVVADLNEAFAGRDREAILALVPRLSILAPSREETRLLLPGMADDDAAKCLAQRGPAVVQKRGEDGAYGVDAGGGANWSLPAPPARLVDPTGAGDATVGALAAALGSGYDLRAAAATAMRIGAIAISGHGASALCPALAPIPINREPYGAPAR